MSHGILGIKPSSKYTMSPCSPREPHLTISLTHPIRYIYHLTTGIAYFTGLTAFSAYLYRNFRGPDQPKLQVNHVVANPSKLAPPKIENLPEKVPYLLIGAGTASHSAMRAIRGQDPTARVLMIGSENRNPYMRPALSKELWFSDKESRTDLKFKWWNGKDRSIFYEIDEFFIPIGDLDKREYGGVSLIKNTRLTKLDPDNRIAYLNTGQSIKFDKCLLAPGGKPKSLPELDAASEEVKERVVYFRTADDFLRLERIASSAESIIIIGGGFLGSELTCALAKRHSDEKVPEDQAIYQIFPESGNLGKVLPTYLSEWLSKKIENEGAHIVPNCEIKSISMSEDKKKVKIKLSNDETIYADYIVCATGLEPDVELAKVSGLEVDEKTGGYLVNSELEARTDVWVAGDASCFYDTKLGRRRVEHHDHAIHSGRQAGQNMMGAHKTYSHQSMFWSDLGSDISFEAVGIIDSSLPTVSVFAQPEDLDAIAESNKEETSEDKEGKENVFGNNEKKPSDKYCKGVVFYLKDDVIVGILLWNLFSRLTIARRILNEQKKYDDFNEVAKLFNIYLDD